MNLLTFVVVVSIILILMLSFSEENGPKYLYKNNTAMKVINIKPHEYQCSDCNMDVENLNYLAEVITKNGNTYFFDDIGCVVSWAKKHQSNIEKIFTKTLDTNRWVDAKSAWYTRTAASPMGYGFAAMEDKKEGLISYDTMKLYMLQGKNLHDPFIKKKLLGE
jgi:hypothetical protein